MLGVRFGFLPRRARAGQVYTMVTHAVLEHTHLLYGRHLDQLLLSALYGVAKVHALRQVTFKDIIAHYKRQPQARTPIFRTVAITLTDPDLQARATLTLTLPPLPGLACVSGTPTFRRVAVTVTDPDLQARARAPAPVWPARPARPARGRAPSR
jgi:hypothetical protein